MKFFQLSGGNRDGSDSGKGVRKSIVIAGSADCFDARGNNQGMSLNASMRKPLRYKGLHLIPMGHTQYLLFAANCHFAIYKTKFYVNANLCVQAHRTSTTFP